MPRGYWSAILAVVGLATLGLSAMGWMTLGESKQQNKSGASSNQASSQHDRSQQQLDRDRAGIIGIVERQISNPEPSNNKEKEQRDLAAQESMSVFAFWVVLIGAGQLGATVVGLIWIRGQLKTSIKAERPHVRFYRTIKTTTKRGRLSRIKGVNFRNYGRTPALVKSLSIKYALSEKPPLPSSAGEPRIYPDDAVMPQDEEWPRKHHIPPWDGEPDLDELVKLHGVNGKRLFVFGILTYVDAFGEERITRFCRVFNPPYFGFNQSDVDGQKELNYTT